MVPGMSDTTRSELLYFRRIIQQDGDTVTGNEVVCYLLCLRGTSSDPSKKKYRIAERVHFSPGKEGLQAVIVIPSNVGSV